MEFLKALKAEKTPMADDLKQENGEEMGKSVDKGDEDDGDFIMNEVKRRLKELRRNSFMVLIPEEETCAEDETETEEEEGEAEWRDVEEEGRQLWSCFGPFYDKYCERMLFFDRLSTQLLKQIGSSPRSVSNKFRCLSLKKTQHPQEDDPYLDLETSYVSQLCLTWEALHCQYTQLTACQSEPPSKCYSHSAQQFQQFQVLLQRFIENEPFEPGLRPEVYAHARNSFPKLLQVPNISGQEMTEGELVRAPDLIRIIESLILTFQMFIKTDRKKKKKSNGLFGGQGQNQMATPLQQVQSALEKRKVKLKELWKKRRKGGKKNEWLATQEEVEVLLGVIDVKVMSRVLRMVKITKEHLFWSEEKMKKLIIDDISGKLERDPSPILFPC